MTDLKISSVIETWPVTSGIVLGLCLAFCFVLCALPYIRRRQEVATCRWRKSPSASHPRMEAWCCRTCKVVTYSATSSPPEGCKRHLKLKRL